MRVIIIYGSANDKDFLSGGRDYLDAQSVPYDEHVLSAHRNLPELLEFLGAVDKSGEKAVILAVAGLAAALPGVVAATTELPCIGVPVPCGPLHGVDALLAICQVPGQVPLATVGLHGKAPLNACMFAHRILKLAGFGDSESPR